MQRHNQSTAADDTSRPPTEVHYHQDIFIVAVSRDVTYDRLAEEIGQKIRLYGWDESPHAPLRIKYRDLVSIGSDEDVF